MDKSIKPHLLLAGGLCLAASAHADSFVLNGTQMTVGVDESGGLVHDLIEDSVSHTFGITPGWRPAVDYLRPGSPFQFYSIGMSGNWDYAGYDPGNNFSATTANTSAGTTLSARTTGAFTTTAGTLNFTQLLWFGINDTTIRYEVTFENTGNTVLEDVVYAVGLDPDQEFDTRSTYDTFNSILDPNTVIAVGPTDGDWIWIRAEPGQSNEPSISYDWYTDPYLLYNSPPNDGYGDYTISMAFSLGTMDPGDVRTVRYEIAIGAGAVVPEPAHYALVGSLGLLGLAAWRRFKR